MANANTNIVSIDITQPSRSVNSNSSRTYKGTQHSYSSRHSNTSDFNSALNKANNQINRQSQPAPRAKELPNDEPVATKTDAKTDSSDVVAKTPPQGQNNQAQDAPQEINQKPAQAETSAEQVPAKTATAEQVPAAQAPVEQIPAEQVPTENLQAEQIEIPANVEGMEIPADIFVPVNAEITEDIPAPLENDLPDSVFVPVNNSVTAEIEAPIKIETESAEEIPETAELPEIPPAELNSPFFFVSHPESLLQTKATENTSAVNLMAIMPQSNDGTAQSMLDILSGKTWKSADVQESIAAQNQPPPALSTNEFQPASLNSNQNLELQQNPPLPQQNLQVNSPETFTANNKMTQPLQISTQPQPLQSLNQFAQSPQNLTQQPQEQILTVQPQISTEQNTQPLQQVQSQIQPIQPQIQQNLSAPIEIEQPIQILNEQAQQPAQAAPLQMQQNQQPVQFQTLTQSQVPQPQFQAVASPLTLIQNSQQQSPVELPPISPQQFEQQIPQVNAILPQVDARIFHQNVPQDLMNFDSPMQDNPASAPVNPTQQTAPQQQFAQNQSQQQFTAENFQQNLAQVSTAEVSAQPTSSGEGSFAQNLSPVLNNTSPAQPTATAQAQNANATAQAPREPFNIPNQIIESARLIRNSENTEMVINLKPEHLGQLTIRVSVAQNGALTANFYSDNAQVRAAIENSLVQLKQELNDQGLKVENVQVYAGLSDGGLTNGQGQQAWQQNQQQPNRNGGRIDFSALEEEVDALAPVNDSISADGVDYKV